MNINWNKMKKKVNFEFNSKGIKYNMEINWTFYERTIEVDI